jgi:ATP-dependent DNA helicase RecQ
VNSLEGLADVSDGNVASDHPLERAAAQLGDSAGGEEEAWLRAGAARAFRALSGALAFADRGALIRDLVRYQGGTLTVSASLVGLDPTELHRLHRFGVDACVSPSDPLQYMLRIQHESDRWAHLPPAFQRALVLDPTLRRATDPQPPDGLLLRLTSHARYRTSTQKAAVRALATMPRGGTLLVTMPTGAGKSLLFQLGARLWREERGTPGACAVVIVPTIALALDHQRALMQQPGLQGSRALTGGLGTREREDILLDFVRGDVPVLLLSPELALGAAREALQLAAQREKPSEARSVLAGFFVDEAHIVESWGRTFRPDFQRLPGLVAALRERQQDLRTVLLSATVSDSARNLLLQSYGRERLPSLRVAAAVPRYEFDIVVEEVPTADDRDRRVLDAVDRLPRPAIIYTSEVEHAERLFTALRRDRKYERVALFTGDVTDPSERQRIIEAWALDQLDLVVATSAFGMGIDKADVRAVVHACVPSDPARYYQEIGRAGRDGHQALALCLWSAADIVSAKALASKQWLSTEKATKRWEAIRRSLGATPWDEQHDAHVADIPLDVAHEEIGPWPGMHNRRWNMSLLNLLQRAKAVEVLVANESADGGPVWRVAILDPRLLETGPGRDEALASAFDARNLERDESREEIKILERLLHGSETDCFLRSLFYAIEAGDAVAAPCGRCPGCHSLNVTPPMRVRYGGGRAVWGPGSPRPPGRLPAGTTLIHPHDALEGEFEGLLVSVARLGGQQFVVPRGTGARAAAVLAQVKMCMGIVLESDALVGGDWTLANLPTAVFFDADATAAENAALYGCVAPLWQQWQKQVLVIVASAQIELAGRPLAQVVSKSAPYSSTALAQWAAGA